MEQFQSPHKPSHITESAVLKVQDEILQAVDNDQCGILLLLDLSAAFDTVDHRILLARLTDWFGIHGKAHAWFKSYVRVRMQFFAIGSSRSSSLRLNCGVPQRSVLSPILYLIYVEPLGDIMGHLNVSFYFYANDTQLYVSFKSYISGNPSRASSTLEPSARDTDIWMLCNKLKLNDNKTEMLIFHAKHRPAPLLGQLQRSHLISHLFRFCKEYWSGSEFDAFTWQAR